MEENKHTYSNGVAPRQDQEENAVDAKEIIDNLLANWYWILLSLILAIVGANLYLRYAIPIYQAKGTILIKDNMTSPSGEFSEEMVLQELGVIRPSTNITNEIQILKSRTLMEEVVRQLGLDITYFGIGRIKETELYRSSPLKVDSVHYFAGPRNIRLNLLAEENQMTIAENGEERTIAYGQPFVTERYDTLWINKSSNDALSNSQRLEIVLRNTRGAANFYLSKLKITVAQDFSSVLNLELQDPVPQKAADILNTLVREYNQDAIEDKNQVASRTLDFIENRLALLTGELGVVESSVETYKTENEIPSEAGGLVNFAVSQRAQYEQDLTRQSIRLDLVKNLENLLVQENEDLQLIPPNMVVEGAESLNSEIIRFNELLLERERMQRSAGAENVQLAALNQQLVNMKLNILDGVRLFRANLERVITSSREKLDQLDQRIEAVPRQERELVEIVRQQNIKENLYLFLLQKKEETALSTAVTSPNARVIDAAIAGGTPLKPKPLQVYALGFLLATFFPVSIIFLRTLLNDKIYTEEDIRKITQLPFLGSVVQSKGKEAIVVHKGSRSMVDEMIRLLRTNINFLRNGKPQQSILITSSMSGDGKSFLTVNLGISLSLADNRVLLLGLDLRKPQLANYLVQKSDKALQGLTNYLVGEADVEEIIYPVESIPNLYFLPCGPIPPNPTEILGSERMGELFQSLKQRFSMILMDTAPIGLVADGLVLQKFADMTLFTVRSGETSESAVKDLNQMYREGKINNPAIVLNGVRKMKGLRYGGKYGYGYGYGYGYYEEKKKRSKAWF